MVAAHQRDCSQHPTGLLADFYIYDESAKVHNAVSGYVLETVKDRFYFTKACRCAVSLASF